ncbi:hypothetical protein EV424DRAFT_1355557 [Suillus variegatus]|nr:hypothetical protein EV424DRAFT_1355557 [Suillus variegatus]
MDDDNSSSNESRKRGSSALQLGPHKRALKSDPLVSHGRHFGQTVFALCNYPSLLTNVVRERREHLVFERLLDSYPGLLERLTKQQLQSGEIAVSGDQWPHFLYANETYDPDNPWNGLLRSRLLINAFRHVFTLPSSVEKEPKAMRAGNARIHGMTAVTIPSVAYIATQVRFAICSSSVFSRTDTTTDSETFYHSLLDLLEDPDERGEVTDLFVWWNRQIFPTSSAAKQTLKANSALSKIRQKRAALKDANAGAL